MLRVTLLQRVKFCLLPATAAAAQGAHGQPHDLQMHMLLRCVGVIPTPRGRSPTTSLHTDLRPQQGAASPLVVDD
jgi:hypothetical protein